MCVGYVFMYVCINILKDVEYKNDKILIKIKNDNTKKKLYIYMYI